MCRHQVTDILISVVLGYVLYSLSALSFLVSFPILMLSRRYGAKEVFISALIVFLLICGTNVWQARNSEFNLLLFCEMAIGLFIPFSLLFGSVLWVMGKGKSVLIRWFNSQLPAIVVFLIFDIWFCFNKDLATEMSTYLGNMMITLWGDVISQLGFDAETFSKLSVLVSAFIILPMTVLMNSIIEFISTASLKARDPEFNFKVAIFTVPDRLIWPFLGLWMFVLLDRLFNYPLGISAFLTGAVSIITYVYMFDGFCVLFHRHLKKKETAKAINMFFLLIAIGMFVPGLNIFLVFILSILGILETWFTIRK